MKKYTTIFILILFASVSATTIVGCESTVNNQMQSAANNLATEAEKAYEIAAKNGEWMDAQAQAAMAAGFYLEAKDETNYQKWKAIQKDAEAKAMKQMGL